MSIPISLAETNGSLQTGNQAILAECLTGTVDCPPSINIKPKSSLLTDDQALLVSTGKPESCKTFGNLADHFIQTVHSLSFRYERVDIVFDRYR